MTTITSYDALLERCEQVAITGKAEHCDILLDVLREKSDEESEEYRVSPVHCQRNHEEHSQDLEEQFEEENGYVDGLGNNFHIVVPTKDFDVISNGKVTFQYFKHDPNLGNGNSRRNLWDGENCPLNYLPPSGIIHSVLKPYSDHATIKRHYDKIDNKDNAQSGADDIYGAFRANNIHKDVKGYIASGKIGRVLKFAYPFSKKTAFEQVKVYKDEIVCTSNLKDYDTPWSFLGRNNANRPCALAAAFLLLKERNREDDTKNVIKRVINEGKIYWEDPLIYFTKVFDRFGVRFNPLDSSFQKTSLMKFEMTPIERILWETFQIPDMSKQAGGEQSVTKYTYFENGAQYQFNNPKRIISFYLYMLQKARENNVSYVTEKARIIPYTKDTDNVRKERIEVFGGVYEKKVRGQLREVQVKSPYDIIIDSIFEEEYD